MIRKYLFIVGFFSCLVTAEFSNSFLEKVKESGNDSTAFIFKIGTLGVGADFEYIYNSFLGLRANLNGFSYKDSGKLEENDYNYAINLKTIGVLVDYHPWQNAFRFSFGMYENLSTINAKVKPTSGEIVVADHKYKSRQIGDINTDILLNKKNPYFGLGFSSTEIKGVHFSLDVGVLYIGSPQAKLTAKAAKGYEGLQDILEKEARIEEEKINNDISKYKYYPVLSVGMQYKF